MGSKYNLLRSPNVQVTSGTPKQARSESVVAVNPLDSRNLIAASKKFSNPQTYHFSIGVRVSLDGGQSWTDAELPKLPQWGDFVGVNGQDPEAGMTDPAVAFDALGNAFFLGEPIRFMLGGKIDTLGMYVYKSTDGGLTWGPPQPLHIGDVDDDKGWIACDQNPASPFFGNVYVAWGAAAPLRFARSTDHGKTWRGKGNSAPGSVLTDQTFAPEISVGPDGTVHIVWFEQSSKTIQYMRSVDGGESFGIQTTAVWGVRSLDEELEPIAGFAHFPDATFRVMTLATGCGFTAGPSDKNFVVAWSDFREGAARIYYRTTDGAYWDDFPKGRPLLDSSQVSPSLHHFHPQIVASGGVLGCAYYEYGPKGGKGRIDVMLSASFDHGETFGTGLRITERPWDPAVDAPWSHGNPNLTFIGEYFGLDVHEMGFDVIWTDTRTGVQELFYDRVTSVPGQVVPDRMAAEVLFGVAQDGGGAVVVGGHVIKIPPRGPLYDAMQALVAADAAGHIQGTPGRALTASAFDTLGAIARTAAARARAGIVAVGALAPAVEAGDTRFDGELRETLEVSALR